MRTLFTAFTLSTFAMGVFAAEKAPNLTLRNLSGEKVKLTDYRGKIVVLNFWATWCGPCREEMPMLVEAEKAWAGNGVAFIAISLDGDKTKAEISSFTARYHVGFPVWTGASADELDKFRLGDGVPDTVFIDENGIIIGRVLGEIRRGELDERLAWLTGGRKGEQPKTLVNHM